MAANTHSLRRDAQFLALAGMALMVVFSALRAGLFWRNSSLAGEIPASEILAAFATGLRFDLVVTAYILLPLVIALFAPGGLATRRLARLWLQVASVPVIFLGVLELDFYRVFHTRLNSLVFQYIREDPVTVVGMVWAGFPVVEYALLVVALWSGFNFCVARIDQLTRQNCAIAAPAGLKVRMRRWGSAACLLLLTVAAARGSLSSGPPLRWGDAFHSEHTFANHLALNGTFTLVKATSAMEHASLDQWWLNRVDRAGALATTRAMVLTEDDQPMFSGDYPLLRRHQPGHDYPAGRAKNLVLIIMESFAGDYVGALGNDLAITPRFDALSEEGLLFTRFFANGTHTHQGMFATVDCFPNLPGHEYLMQQPEGLHEFSGLPRLFTQASGNHAYLYNGDFRWDNQRGFFQNQGMSRFIGRDQIDAPRFTDKVWGVSDEDVFRQAVGELDAMWAKGPFYAVIQTLSNHTPFSLPDPLPITAVDPALANSEHLTAMRYADWALGEFFAAIRDKPYFHHTVFVMVGDHGFGNSRMVSRMDLVRYRVPMLIIAPAIRDYFDSPVATVASQVDIVPTALSLLGHSFVNQCWGRDILSLRNDKGFAVIKPSGSDQMAALISGEYIVSLSPDTAPELEKLDFSGALVSGTAHDRELEQMLVGRLQSYIQTALAALRENHTGTGRGNEISPPPAA